MENINGYNEVNFNSLIDRCNSLNLNQFVEELINEQKLIKRSLNARNRVMNEFLYADIFVLISRIKSQKKVYKYSGHWDVKKFKPIIKRLIQDGYLSQAVGKLIL